MPRGLKIFLAIIGSIVCFPIFLVLMYQLIFVKHIDYERKYREFLEYSLGEYVVEDYYVQRPYREIYFPWEAIRFDKKYKNWDLKYTRDNGDVEYFYLSNDVSFYNSVLSVGFGLGKDEINEKIIKKYYPDTTLYNGESEAYFSVYVDGIYGYGSTYENPEYLSPENGIKLKSVTASDMINRYGAEYWIYWHTDIEGDVYSYADEEKLKSMIIELGNFLQTEQLKITLWKGQNYRDPVDLAYEVGSDKFSLVFESMMGSEFVNDRTRRLYQSTFTSDSINIRGLIYYCEEDGQYYVNTEFIESYFKILGKEIDYFNYEFIFNDDIYLINKDYINERVLIYKNDALIHDVGQFEDKAMTLDELKAITGYDYEFDIEKGITYIKN